MDRKMDARAVLVGAWKLLAKGWCQHGEARDADGCIVDYFRANAVAFCSSGSIYRAAMVVGAEFPAVQEARRLLVDAIGGRMIVSWNDAPKRTQEQVLAAFDKAVASLGENP